LPCSGKSTLADKLKEEMDDKTGYHPIRLDGDDIRGKGKLNEDLGFSDRDRLENLRRVSHLSRIHNENKSTVLATFVSPTEELRGYIKNIIGPERFKLIYVKCPLEVCEQRDVKGMYKKARAGEIKEFTGISAPFEEPVNADVVVDTSKYDIRECLNKISSELKL